MRVLGTIITFKRFATSWCGGIKEEGWEEEACMYVISGFYILLIF